MELTPSQKLTVRHQFDSFSRKILREECRIYIKKQIQQSEKEVMFSELSEEQFECLYVVDQYPSEQYRFTIQGFEITIADGQLAEALADLSDENRDIVLLAYFLDMPDWEIAQISNLGRRTVQRRRTNSLEEIKKRMEVKDDGKSE